MNIFKQGIKKHRNLFRGICLIISLFTLTSLILSMLKMCPTWVFGVMMILYIFIFVPAIDLEEYNRVDYILFSILMVLSLSICAILIMGITNMISHNTNITIYFGITSFFLLAIYMIYILEKLLTQRIFMCLS